MSYNGMTYGDISPRVGLHAVATMLATAKNQLILEKYAMVQALPKNKGLVIKWRRPIKFAAATTPLQEGVTPSPQQLGYEDVSATIQQYGAWIPYTDVIQDTHEDPNLSIMSELCGEQAALTKERVIWGVLRGGTSVFYTDTATSRATVTAPVTIDEIRAAVRNLKNNHAAPLTKVLKASTNIATEPVSAAYILFAHTNMEADFRDMTGFVEVKNYASGGPTSEYELGSVENVRIILTNHLEPFYGAGSASISGVLNNGTNVDVYPLVIVGKDAYAVTPLSGNGVEMAVKNPKMGTSYEDPLGQRGFVSWKMWFVATRLNEAWMTRIESACSIL
jgi:N4-gp56 family major capsid protein